MPTRVEVVCVGTELLSGKVNTHAAYIARELESVHLTLGRETSVCDSIDEIREAVTGALWRCEVLFVCGGLGPTFDDVTREGVAAAVGAPLIYKKELFSEIRAKLRRYHHAVPEENKRQAFLIEGARALRNRYGSAPGQLLDWNGKLIVLFPGPPSEFYPMFAAIVPELKRRYADGSVVMKRAFRLCGILEAQADELLQPLLLNSKKPGLEFTILAQPGQVDFHVTAWGDNRTQAARRLAWAQRQVRRRTGPYIFGLDDETLESAVGKLLRARKQTLAAAESCTGGMLSERLTQTPGSSDYFLGSVVAYDNRVKTGFLGVSEQTLKRHGAVSSRCAEELAQGALARFGSDWAVSITGIAGPGGGSAAKPVGLVFIGLARRGQRAQARKYLFAGSREQVRQRSTVKALTLLWRSLIRMDSKSKN